MMISEESSLWPISLHLRLGLDPCLEVALVGAAVVLVLRELELILEQLGLVEDDVAVGNCG